MILIYSAFAFGTNISVAKSSNYLGDSGLDYLSISLGAKSRYQTEDNTDRENQDG